MVPRPNLGGGSIYALHPVHPKPKHTSYEETIATPRGWGACAHSGDSTRIEKFDSSMFHFQILIKAFQILIKAFLPLFCTHFLSRPKPNQEG